ncbi:MAG: hypothetical protein PHY94_02255 [Candidatus Omnitrophica bacterium]|nr:hypothetical protein [Candidatus Omnitrophota bacterium]
MQRKIKYLLPLSLLLLFTYNSAYPFEVGRGAAEALNNLPEPRLIFPITETVVLTGKNDLEFKWGGEYAVTVDYYDFRLYKGYNTVEANLILKKQIPSDITTTKISADTFTDAEVYTWVLKQVSLGGQKSDASFDSFKVIKK